MSVYFNHILIQGFIGFQVAVLLVAISNLLILHHRLHHLSPSHLPKVSILIPARNEEKNIAGCIHSLINQDYPDFELLVLDDQSTDHTWITLQQLSQQNPGLTILAGKPLPFMPVDTRSVIAAYFGCQVFAETVHDNYIVKIPAI